MAKICFTGNSVFRQFTPSIPPPPPPFSRIDRDRVCPDYPLLILLRSKIGQLVSSDHPFSPDDVRFLRPHLENRF